MNDDRRRKERESQFEQRDPHGSHSGRQRNPRETGQGSFTVTIATILFGIMAFNAVTGVMFNRGA